MTECRDVTRHEALCAHKPRYIVSAPWHFLTFSDGCELECCDACWWDQQPFAWGHEQQVVATQLPDGAIKYHPLIPVPWRIGLLDIRGVSYGPPRNAVEAMLANRRLL